MQNVKNILDSLLQPSSQTEAWKMNLIKNWPTIIGSLHEKVSLQKINATSVVLGVYDSCWIQELYLLSKLILKKINNSLDRPRIETLRFQCIEKKEHIVQKKAAMQRTERITALKPKEISALQKIHDPELSAALEGILRKCQQ
ncbi:MAG: DciA family protein [Flavobacterium sp.]|nr:DciA family protein [Flavobacterium sp.]